MVRDRTRRVVFDQVADGYQQGRPDYPKELFEDLLDITAVKEHSALLEIGCGPGKATLPLAQRGLSIVAIDSGKALIGEAEKNLAQFSNVHLHRQAFEAWHPDADESSFDLVYAANAWAWLEPDTKYQKVSSLLRRGGFLAVWDTRQAFPVGYDTFFDEMNEIYLGTPEENVGPWPPPGPEDTLDLGLEFSDNGFSVEAVRRYVWAVEYGAEDYLRLLNTFAGHIALDAESREKIFGGAASLIEARPTQTIVRHWLAILTVGRNWR